MTASAIDWKAQVDRAALAAAGWDVVEFEAVLRGVREAGAGRHRRVGLGNPAQAWLDRVAAAPRLAVVGVRLTTLSELSALHGLVLEPAWRAGTSLLVQSEQRLTTLSPADFVDSDFGYAYTLARALDVAMRMFDGASPRAARAADASESTLDPEQRLAVDAHDGVVQVIAPAGSGKTTVLIARVRELMRRGTPADEILCATFNRPAAIELADRLAAAGVRDVQARTFHSLGLWILRDEGLVDGATTRTLSLNEWRRLCAIAASGGDGTWVEPADARAAIADIKLGLLATAAEFRPRAAERADGATIARIYELYEEQQRAAGAMDFDDQLMWAVRALRTDAALRTRWQERFTQVLVDEYQDIEPAQELLVRILAAPQDGYFCVGDEDQTLYGWRRASARRMIDLDLAYPGLERISLAHNYRCPPQVVSASRRLIERNVVRFPKPIEPAPGRLARGPDAIELWEEAEASAAAERVARALIGRRRGDVVVLARTTNLLRTVALACVAPGVRISAPRVVFEPSGARRALEAYLRLLAEPASARPEDVAIVCRAPGRGLPFEREGDVASRLCDGCSFATAFAGLATDDRRRARLADAARVLDDLAGISDAAVFIAYLRGAGGLDAYFAEQERTFADAEQVELEILRQTHEQARGRTVAELSALLDARAHALRDIRDDEHGVELATIHVAKGREWPEVFVFGCDEGQLPHRLALDTTPEQEAAGEGTEAERRLAYVAFTRAKQRLVVCATESVPSRFLSEAGLAPRRPYVPPAPAVTRDARPRPSQRPSSTRPQPGTTRGARIGPEDGRLAKAMEVGLGYAMRTAPSPRIALQTAAAVLEQRLVGEPTTSGSMTAAKLLANVDGLDAADGAGILERAGIADDAVLLSRLDADARRRLALALRSRA